MSKRLRFIYRYFLALVKKEWKLLLIGLAFLSILIFFFTTLSNILLGSSKETAKKLFKPTFYGAIVGNPTTFNPLFSKLQSEKEINSLVFRGLTKVANDGKIVGDLAKSWEIKNNTTYIFHLKNNIKWQDGQQFNADDVVYTVGISQNPLYQSEYANDLKDVTVSKINPYTVEFKLKEAFAPFLSSTTFGIIPQHIPLNNYRPVGTGSFKITNVKADSVTLNSSNIKLIFKFYPTVETALTAVKLGEVHALSSSQADLSELKNWRNFKLTTSILPFQLVVAFFNYKNSSLNEKPVRQALSFASPKQSIVNYKYGSKGIVALNSLPDTKDLQSGQTVDKYAYNLDKAASLLTADGWVLQDGSRVKNGKDLSLTITTIDEKEFEDTALKLKDSWEKLGLKVGINVVSGLELKNQIVPNRTFDVLLSSQLLSTDPDQYVLWHTTQIKDSNISGITSPKIDKLLEDGRQTLDPKQRAEKYSEFTRLLLDEAPAVFLYYPNYAWVYSKRVENVDLTNFLFPESRFDTVSNWEIKNPLF